MTTIYHFGHPVVAEGGWLAAGTPFSMRYLAEFADAVADFDLGRNPQLLLHHAGQSEAVHMSPLSGYDVEIRHLVEAITTGRTRLDATLADASAVADLLEAERTSVQSRRRVEL